MNAFYVTVSIPLLLVLAGFNHAHGLTTFGKTNNNQGTQATAKPNVQAATCKNQTDCRVTSTTCIHNSCLCGNGENPTNGVCKETKRGIGHLCTKDDDCVPGAECVAAKDANKTNTFVSPTDKICYCSEGIDKCGGESNFLVLPGLLIIVTAFSRTLN